MSVPAEQMDGSVPSGQNLSDAVNSGINKADSATDEVTDQERDAVSGLVKEYGTAREFDRFTREQYNKDRRYASGMVDITWASDANIIGAFIDILVSFLYAQNPDVSVRPAPRAGAQPDQDAHDFSETLQIVISRLWKDAKLKRIARKIVRSALSVGVGWMKVLVYSQTKRNPQIEAQIRDVQQAMADIQALQESLVDTTDPEELNQRKAAIEDTMVGLQANVEQIVKQGMCVDFVRAEDMQVSLDVSDTSDYLDADWLSNDMYMPKDTIRARFPVLTESDVKTAATYYQRQTNSTNTPQEAQVTGSETAQDGQFSKSINGPIVTVGGQKPVEFVKVVELWDRRECVIKTFVDGVKKWAVAPYAPPQAATRFYPYFRLAFFEVDGSRHPQSLSWRLRKLQDEYSHARSNGRLTRERSVPGTVFNMGQLSQEDARKLENSTHLEMVGINPTSGDLALDKIITAKPIPRVDPALFDTSPIKYDMEVLSGVQEAQQGAMSSAKTATEAEIQQSGFNSRTGADRDSLEEMLNDLAEYTGELAVQSLTVQTAQKYAGMLAFWPEGMDTQDVLMMLNIEIQAGTTGKPAMKADKETWATLLPLIQSMMQNIQQLDMTNPPLAKAYRNLMRETLRRLDDRLDIDSIIPPPPPQIPGLPGAPGALPGAPPVPGAPPGAVPGAPPVAPPPVGNGSINKPPAPPPVK